MDEYPNQYDRELNTIEEISVVQFERYHLPTSVHIDLFKIKYNLEKKFIQKIYQHIPRNARAELIRLKKKLIYVPVTLTERSFSTETAAVKLFVD